MFDFKRLTMIFVIVVLAFAVIMALTASKVM